MIGRSIYGVVVIDGLLYSRFYGTIQYANKGWFSVQNFAVLLPAIVIYV